MGGREAGSEVKNEIEAKKGIFRENEQEICEIKQNNRSKSKKSQKCRNQKIRDSG